MLQEVVKQRDTALQSLRMSLKLRMAALENEQRKNGTAETRNDSEKVC